MPTILEKITATKLREIAAAKARLPERELRARLVDAPPLRDFFAPLAAGGPIRLIAEVKKASPSQGVIREDFDPVQIARVYEQNGAACISVLTDETYFQGRLDYLQAIRSQVNLPLLRKDFILDPYQLLEARTAGADAVLLIAECLDDCNLRKLHNEALELGLTPLVEFYEEQNLARVLEAGAALVGVNNRDLRTFHTDLEHVIRLKSQIPEECVLVGESGIHSRQDALRLERAGIDAMLVGEHVMAASDIAAAVRELLGKGNAGPR
jgi:indole-3-glycerol phosphate synthase